MVKIKVKKEMNLPELIKWGWDNEAIGRFEGDKGSLVLFDANSWVISNKFVCSEETFEVEVEEEITEDTVIPDLIELFEHTGGIDAEAHSNTSIHQLIRGADEDVMSAISLYMLNDDMTMTLIWRNGEMVK